MTFSIDHTRLAADYCTAIRGAVTAAQLADVHLYIDVNEAAEAALNAQGHSLFDGSAPALDAANRAMAKGEAHGYQLRRVMVGCEFSGRVRDAIAQFGHSVVSCDILPTESPGPHIIGDLREHMNDGYSDMLSFPPCTFLCASSAKHRKGNFARWRDTVKAIEFVKDLQTADVERSMLENSIGILPRRIGKWSQRVQTYHYGEDHSKQTCLWLDGLPLLTNDPADHIAPRIVTLRNGKTAERWANQCDESGADNTPESPERWRIRSRIKHGLANAFAAQWFNTAGVHAA